MKNWQRNIFVVLLSLVLAVILIEVILRFIGFSYPNFYCYNIHTASSLRPGAKGWYKNEGEAFVRINKHGMRDDREVALQKPPNTYRIAVLGDSYAEAVQVDVSKTFWRLLESLLQECNFAQGKTIEVLNFGVSGFSTGQELLTLREHARLFAPDLVICAFLSGNDVRDNSKETGGKYPRPFFELHNGHLVLDNGFKDHPVFKLKSSWAWRMLQALSNYSRLFHLVNKVKNIIEAPLTAPAGSHVGQKGREIGLDDAMYLSTPPPVWERAWNLTEALVKEIQIEAKQMGAGFLLVTLSNGIQVTPDAQQRQAYAARLGEPDLFYPERRMADLARREGMDAVFLAQPFSEYALKHKVYLHGFPNTVMGDGHWNEQGHALAAQIIGDHLCKKNNSKR